MDLDGRVACIVRESLKESLYTSSRMLLLRIKYLYKATHYCSNYPMPIEVHHSLKDMKIGEIHLGIGQVII